MTGRQQEPEKRDRNEGKKPEQKQRRRVATAGRVNRQRKR